MTARCRSIPFAGNRYRFRDDSNKLQQQLCQRLSGTEFDPMSTFSYATLEAGYGRLVKLATDAATQRVREVHALGMGYVPTKKERLEHAKRATKELKETLFGGTRPCSRDHIHCLLCSQLIQVSGTSRGFL
jgi:hypothetical protein